MDFLCFTRFIGVLDPEIVGTHSAEYAINSNYCGSGQPLWACLDDDGEPDTVTLLCGGRPAAWAHIEAMGASGWGYSRPSDEWTTVPGDAVPAEVWAAFVARSLTHGDV